jgi:hypothetical protein
LNINGAGVVSGSAQITASVFGVVSGDITITAAGVATIGANSVALETDTTGNYVASLVAGTNITLSNNSGEGATPTIGLTNNTISGITLGSNLATLTIDTGLSGTSYNGSTGVTITNSDRGSSQNIFKNIAVSGQSTVVADANDDTLTLVAGSNVTITTNATTDTITIATTSSPTFAGLTTSSDITVNGLTIGRGSGNVEGNTVVGQGAGQSNIGGYWNSFFGERAGNANTSGYGNSFFGTQAGLLNQTGEYNTYIGHVAGYQIMGSNNTIIGVAQGTAGLSGTIIIAAGTTERIRVNSVGVMSVVGSATFTGDVTANTSDKRLKDNIRVIDNPLEKLSKINGVYFNWNDTAKDLIHKSDDIEEVGFLAQEVQSVLPHIVKPAPFDIDVLTGESKSGENYLTIQYEKIVPLLVEAIKELKKQVDELKNK